MTAGLFVLLKEKQEDGFQSKVLRHCEDNGLEFVPKLRVTVSPEQDVKLWHFSFLPDHENHLVIPQGG